MLVILDVFMDTIALILVTTPNMHPLLIANGMDPVLVGILLLIAIETGINAPIAGMNIFVLKGNY